MRSLPCFVLVSTVLAAAGAARGAEPAASAEPGLGATAPAELDDGKRDCLNHHEGAQLARRAGSLLQARAELLLCSQATCPAAIRGDCVEWMDQVLRSLPSVVVTARADGRDLVAVTTIVDGKLVSERLTGAALELDPGEHRLRFEAPPWPAVEHTILVSEGVKRRPIEVDFVSPAAPASAVARPPAGPPPTVPGRHWDYLLGGVAVVGLGTFAGLGSWALYDRYRLAHRCAPFCSEDEAASVHTKAVLADIGLGAAVVALAALYVHRAWSGGERGPRAAGAGLVVVSQPTRDGAVVGMRGSF